MSEEQPTVVELYLQSKAIRYQLTNGQCKVHTCPYCQNTNWKFFVNAATWLNTCHVCGVKGNERSLKKQLGDVIPGVSSSQDVARRHDAVESIPDIEAAHQALLANDAVLNWLNDERGFSLEIVKQQKLGLGTRKFGDHGNLQALMFPYFAGEHCVGVKYRTLPQSIDSAAPTRKDFRFTNGREAGLYNQNAITVGMDYLLLTEGEADALALMSAGVQNVVGVPGCEGKKVTWDRLLDKPKKLYLLYDTDSVGQKGAYDFATRFGIERFYNIVLPEFDLDVPEGERTKGKDINEWLMVGHTVEELHALMQAARPFEIEGVSGMDDALAECEVEVESGIPTMAYDSPWPSLNARFGGAADGQLVIVAAPQKSGKTTFALNWADYLVGVKKKSVFFECLEMSPKELARKWASFVSKTDDTPGRSKMTKDTFRQARQINQEREADLLFGSAVVKKEEEAFDRIRQVVRRYGCKVVVYDNLQLLADWTLGKSNMGNRVTYISILSKGFKRLAKELGILIILISQTKRLDENTMATSQAVEGSSAPANDCDTMIVMNRARDANLSKKDMESMGDFQTDENFLPRVWLRVDLSRFAPGGVCTMHMEGGMSWIRELSAEERIEQRTGVSGTIQVNAPPVEAEAV